jgi:hypothetical protein
MKSYLPMLTVTLKIRHCWVMYGIADLAERLRRTLKARVRKSVGSIPTVCNNTYFLFGSGDVCGLVSLYASHVSPQGATVPYVRV